ncbi:MAG: TetR/AcrR family transcriptional regulator, partial [Nonlabens sp.]
MESVNKDILVQATTLFLEQGFKSVTMDDISRSMGISKKTLYNHYNNKESLVEASVMSVYDTICCGIDHICDQHVNPIQELYDIKKTVMSSLKGDKTSPIYQLQRYYPKVHKKISTMQFDYMQGCVNENLDRGIQQGLYIPSISKEFVSRIYFVGIQGIKDLSLFPTQGFPVQKLYDQYLEYHLRGIVTPEGRKILNQITN